MTLRNISLIAAQSLNRVIGVHNQLPWHLPADLKHFKSLTLSKPIVMGRKTFESIGRVLPQRRNIIISRDKNFKVAGAEVFISPESVMQTLKDEPEIMIIGGEAVFTYFFPLADRIYLTQVYTELAGDSFFPVIDETTWRKMENVFFEKDPENPFDYAFQVWVKNTPSV